MKQHVNKAGRNAVAIIPARGGSQRIPGKNIRSFAGKPALAYPVSAALESELFSQVIVSTDDPAIAQVAEQYGADVVMRNPELADDQTPIAAVCHDLLKNWPFDDILPAQVCLIYATAVFIQSTDLQESMQLLKEPGTERVLSVCAYPTHPYKALAVSDGELDSLYPQQFRQNTQNYPKVFAHNGVLGWAQVSAFLEQPTFLGKHTKPYPMPWDRSVDIDTPADWAWAERLLQTRHSGPTPPT